MSDHHRTTLTKLAPNGLNWVTYRDCITWLFQTRKWSEHLTNDQVAQSYITAGDINGVTPAQRWEAEECIITELIAESVPDTVLSKIRFKTNAMEIWTTLKGLYEGRTTMIVVDMTRKLQNTKCGEDDDVHAHFTKLDNMRDQISAMGKNFSNEEYASILLGSLPSCYSSTTSGMNAAAYYSGQPTTPDGVVKLITDEYDRRMIAQGKSGNGPEEAFASQDCKIDRSKIECYNCHKKGHYKSECWAKGGDKEGQCLPRRSDNNNHRNNNRNRNNHNRDNNQGSDNANSANTDIEAWSPIEEIEEIQAAIKEINDKFTDQPNYKQIAYSTGPQVHLLEIEIELYDSGASRHMSPFIHRFSNYCSISPRPITATNKHIFYAIGTGDLQIDVPNRQSTTPVTLHDTLHTPDMALTIVSISQIVNSGCSVSFKKKSCKIKNKSGKVVGDIPASSNGLFKVEHSFMAASTNTVEQVNIHMLHRCLGHISADAICNLIHFNAITGIKLIDNGSPIICQSCEYAKLTRKPIKNEQSATPAKQFGDEIHTDLWGPSRTASLGGRCYYITFTDDHTRYTHIDILQTKDEALQSYRDFASWA